MVLHDVSNDPNVVEVATSALGAERFLEGDLDALDEVLVPRGVQEGVTESQLQQVLDQLLAQVVVDSVQFVLGEQRRQAILQGSGTFQVVAKGFLDDNSLDTLVGVHQFLDLGGDAQKDAWRQGEVVESVRGLDVSLAFKVLDHLQQGQIAAVGVVGTVVVLDQLEEGLDLGLVSSPVRLLQVGRDPLPQLGVGQLGPGKAEDLGAGVQVALPE